MTNTIHTSKKPSHTDKKTMRPKSKAKAKKLNHSNIQQKKHQIKKRDQMQYERTKLMNDHI